MQLTKMESSEMTVIAVYRSEQGNSVELLEHLTELIPPEGRTVICGDFNICYLSKRNNRITKYLEENGFTELVKEATRQHIYKEDFWTISTSDQALVNI